MRHKYKDERGLFFLPGNDSPEKYLLKFYLQSNPNEILEYHLGDSNVHILFPKMVELGIAINNDDAFEKCWSVYERSTEFQSFVQEFKYFLITNIKYFSK